jgi:RecA-family ATPase
MDYLVAAIEAYKPDMVIIDNVCDLLPNINEAEDCIRLIDQLMQLATAHNCNITVVIHLNRSGEKRSLRGWLGTVILHKAFEIYYCEQVEKTNVLSVAQSLTRKYHIDETLYYKINDDGLPEVTVKPASYQPRNPDGKYMTNKPEAYQISPEKADTFNQDYIIRNDANARLSWEWDLKKLFGDAMDDSAEMGLDELQDSVMSLSGIKQPKYYDKVFKLAADQRVVQTTMDRYGRVVVIPVTS